MGKNTTNDMTQGNCMRLLVQFFLPILAGNLFQQLYNTADSLIVGNFLGSNALAAVSSSGEWGTVMVRAAVFLARLTSAVTPGRDSRADLTRPTQ